MAEMYQLSFLQTDDVSALEAKVEKNYASQERVRKKLFARSNELEKYCKELEIRLAIIERNICRGEAENGHTASERIRRNKKEDWPVNDLFDLLTVRNRQTAGHERVTAII